jgi:hypothetical protein
LPPLAIIIFKLNLVQEPGNTSCSQLVNVVLEFTQPVFIFNFIVNLAVQLTTYFYYKFGIGR